MSGFDRDLPITELQVDWAGVTYKQAVTPGYDAKAAFTLPVSPATETVTLRAKYSTGVTSAGDTITLRKLGDTNCDGEVHAAIMGDSYISGEGAYGYMPGTDVHGDDGNLCHRSPNSWAARLATSLGAKLWDPEFGSPPSGDAVAFLACSGAVTKNFMWDAQPGDHDPQLNKLSRDYWNKIDLVFMSVGGNDAGFADVIKMCTALDCNPALPLSPVLDAAMWKWRSNMIDGLAEVGRKVGDTEQLVRSFAPGAEVYQVNYMDPLLPQPTITCSSLSPAIAAQEADIRFYLGDVLGIPQSLIHPLIPDTGFLSLTVFEREWLTDQFLPKLDDAVAGAAAAHLGSDHLLDASGAFAGHPICSADPYVNGFTLGDDQLGILGNESFHPNAEGHARLEYLANLYWGTKLGRFPNDAHAPEKAAAAAATTVAPPAHLTLDAPAYAASGSGTLTVSDGPANAELKVTMEPLTTVIGSGRTDADGDATIAVRIPAAAAPGFHLVTAWNGNDQAGLTPALIGTTQDCATGADRDGDGLADGCDTDPLDGPSADIDGDGVANGRDNCQLVANAAQTDSDGDFEGDACDPDQGAARSFRNGGAPTPATPLAPRTRGRPRRRPGPRRGHVGGAERRRDGDRLPDQRRGPLGRRGRRRALRRARRPPRRRRAHERAGAERRRGGSGRALGCGDDLGRAGRDAGGPRPQPPAATPAPALRSPSRARGRRSSSPARARSSCASRPRRA